MSFNREGVLWQTEDGTYRYGLFTVTWEGSEADGYDPEWDVEYDYDSFEWVGAPKATEQAARDTWRGANPGGYWMPEKGSKETARYDRMAAEYDKRPRARSVPVLTLY